MSTRPMLTQREAAAACVASRSTIRRRREAGDLPNSVHDEVRGYLTLVEDLGRRVPPQRPRAPGHACGRPGREGEGGRRRPGGRRRTPCRTRTRPPETRPDPCQGGVRTAARGVRLGVFLSNQKSRRDRLSEDQLTQLANLGLEWAA